MSEIVDFQAFKIKNSINEMNEYKEVDIRSLLNDVLVAYDGVIPITDLATKFNFKVVNGNLSADIAGKMYINGSTRKFYGSDKVILVNAEYSLSLKRLVVAREIAFYLFNVLKYENLNNKKRLIKDIYSFRNQNDIYEEIATDILLPDKEFCPIFLQRTRFGKINSARDYLANYFEVPKVVVKRKIKGLIKG